MAKIGITVSADKKSISKVNHTVNDALKTEDFKALVDSFKLS